MVAEELGRSLAPTPFLGRVVLATTVAMTLGECDFLGSLASGDSSACLLVSLEAHPANGQPRSLSAEAESQVRSVPLSTRGLSITCSFR